MTMPENNTMTINSGEQSKTLLVVTSNDISGLEGGLSGFDVTAGENFSRHLVLQTGASADILVLILPGKDSSLDFRIEMTGQDAQCRLFGLFLCPSDEKVKINVEMLHNAGRCSSHQLFRGIVSGTSRADFYGRIVVAPDAQVTEAYQENHNLLLSDTARIDTQPQLEIYADDVKCSHGAAVGKLNEDEQFYMRSRGIPEDEAKILQMLSFAAPVLDMLPEGDAKDRFASYVEQSVRSAF